MAFSYHLRALPASLSIEYKLPIVIIIRASDGFFVRASRAFECLLIGFSIRIKSDHSNPLLGILARDLLKDCLAEFSLPNLISHDTRLAHNNSEVPTWPIPFSRTALAWVNDCSLDK